MEFEAKELWFGEGFLWKRLIIRELLGKIEGHLMDAQPAWMGTKVIDLSHHTILDDAIREIQDFDYGYYDELTMFGEEG